VIEMTMVAKEEGSGVLVAAGYSVEGKLRVNHRKNTTQAASR
jgi:hypothetical protein